jgi:hypothetical protein
LTPEVDEALRPAKLAFVDLVGLMAAEGLDFYELNLTLYPGWSPVVKHAWQHWQNQMAVLRAELARADGVKEPVKSLSKSDQERWTKAAFELVMSS